MSGKFEVAICEGLEHQVVLGVVTDQERDGDARVQRGRWLWVRVPGSLAARARAWPSRRQSPAAILGRCSPSADAHGTRWVEGPGGLGCSLSLPPGASP